ncbi:MAG: ABC transporter permease, partial [Deltaproteobacteria bacterium]
MGAFLCSLRVQFNIATRNLLQARRRTWLLATALGSVSMLMVLLMTLSQGIADTMVYAATRLLTGHVNVAGFYKTRADNAAMVVTDAPAVARLLRQQTPQAAVLDRARGWGKLTAQQGSLSAVITGVDTARDGGCIGDH